MIEKELKKLYEEEKEKIKKENKEDKKDEIVSEEERVKLRREEIENGDYHPNKEWDLIR